MTATRADLWECREKGCGWWIARGSDYALEVFRDHVWHAHRTCYRCWRRHDPVVPCPKPRDLRL